AGPPRRLGETAPGRVRDATEPRPNGQARGVAARRADAGVSPGPPRLRRDQRGGLGPPGGTRRHRQLARERGGDLDSQRDGVGQETGGQRPAGAGGRRGGGGPGGEGEEGPAASGRRPELFREGG